MEIGIAILLFVCMTALLYVLLSLKISRQVDLQIKEFYKTRIHADMQEFYREMEGYAALFENRIQRFRVLVERNESVLRDAEAPRPEAVPEPVVEAEAELPQAAAPRRDKKNNKKSILKAKAQLKTKVPVKAVAAKKTSAPVVLSKPAPKLSVTREVPQPQVAPRRAVEVMPPAEIRRPIAEAYADGDDSAIAEELMKDLFLKDEVELSQKKNTGPAASVAPVPERAESPGMANFFSRLGKAIEPVLFGEKPASEKPAAKPDLTRTAPPAVSAAKPSSDFSEVLRRAEQIKAEKQAERERAEIEAKAEFYAAGDSFQNLKTAAVTEARARQAIQAENLAARVQPAAEPQVQRSPVAVAEPPRRNNLVVKELDRHTVNFLIDSLVKDNGYRKQALRALTENNIPLDEIARLSKIDIGELELMRQLGRF